MLVRNTGRTMVRVAGVSLGANRQTQVSYADWQAWLAAGQSNRQIASTQLRVSIDPAETRPPPLPPPLPTPAEVVDSLINDDAIVINEETGETEIEFSDRVEQLIDAMDSLTSPNDFTKSEGVPKTASLYSLVGFTPTGRERDLAWAEYQRRAGA